jgi:ribosomal protein S18 acetylase RimI-like enzyme
MSRSFHARGSWPGVVTFRSGWASARARPWNDDLPDASLLLERGGSSLIRAATGWLAEQGAPAVISPPLHPSSVGIWEAAGFAPFRTLQLMERDLAFKVPSPPHPVRPGRQDDWQAAAAIDAAAFAVDWRIGRAGLSDAVSATPRSRFLVSECQGVPAGFAIVGASGTGSYLQRIAVLPDCQHHGYGTALLLAALRWARHRNASTMILNTKPANQAATSLYRAHRFDPLPEPLHIYRYAA